MNISESDTPLCSGPTRTLSRLNGITSEDQKWSTSGMSPYPQKNLVPIIRTESDRESDKRRAYIWRSCCAEMDSRALLFFSQLAISLVVLIFCIYEIAVVTESQWAKMTATFIIGVWLPSPRANK